MIFAQAYAESAVHATGEEEGFSQGGSHGLWQKDWRRRPRLTKVVLALLKSACHKTCTNAQMRLHDQRL